MRAARQSLCQALAIRQMALHLILVIEELIIDLMTARCPGPGAATQAQIISLPQLYLTVLIECLC